MSPLTLISSGLPPRTDLPGGAAEGPNVTRKRHERCGGGAPRRATRRIMGHDLSTISHTLQRNSLQRDNLSKCAMFGYLQAPLEDSSVDCLAMAIFHSSVGK